MSGEGLGVWCAALASNLHPPPKLVPVFQPSTFQRTFQPLLALTLGLPIGPGRLSVQGCPLDVGKMGTESDKDRVRQRWGQIDTESDPGTEVSEGKWTEEAPPHSFLIFPGPTASLSHQFSA